MQGSVCLAIWSFVRSSETCAAWSRTATSSSSPRSRPGGFRTAKSLESRFSPQLRAVRFARSDFAFRSRSERFLTRHLPHDKLHGLLARPSRSPSKTLVDYAHQITHQHVRNLNLEAGRTERVPMDVGVSGGTTDACRHHHAAPRRPPRGSVTRRCAARSSSLNSGRLMLAKAARLCVATSRHVAFRRLRLSVWSPIPSNKCL